MQYGPPVGGLVGDITVDHGSDTYRFQGAADTDLAGIEIVGDAPDASRSGATEGPWERGWSDPRAQSLVALATYLDVVDTDDVLTTTWRDGYVSIDDRETEFLPRESTRRRCTRSSSTPRATTTDHPFQWNEWVATVLPATDCRRRHRSSRCGSTTTA